MLDFCQKKIDEKSFASSTGSIKKESVTTSIEHCLCNLIEGFSLVWNQTWLVLLSEVHSLAILKVHNEMNHSGMSFMNWEVQDPQGDFSAADLSSPFHIAEPQHA